MKEYENAEGRIIGNFRYEDYFSLNSIIDNRINKCIIKFIEKNSARNWSEEDDRSGDQGHTGSDQKNCDNFIKNEKRRNNMLEIIKLYEEKNRDAIEEAYENDKNNIKLNDKNSLGKYIADISKDIMMRVEFEFRERHQIQKASLMEGQIEYSTANLAREICREVKLFDYILYSEKALDFMKEAQLLQQKRFDIMIDHIRKVKALVSLYEDPDSIMSILMKHKILTAEQDICIGDYLPLELKWDLECNSEYADG